MRYFGSWYPSLNLNLFMIHIHLNHINWRYCYTVFLGYLCFDCNLLLNVKCEIFHLWLSVSAQEFQILEHLEFWIFGLEMLSLYMPHVC